MLPELWAEIRIWASQKGAQYQNSPCRGCAWYAAQSTYYKRYQSWLQGSFAFNEAALYAVKYDPAFPEKPAMSTDKDVSRYDPSALCFARFTTLTKHIEPNDSFKITWYILL